MTPNSIGFLHHPGWMCGPSLRKVGSYRVIDRKQIGYRQTNLPTCAKQYALSCCFCEDTIQQFKRHEFSIYKLLFVLFKNVLCLRSAHLTYLQILMMAQSRTFWSAFVSLSEGPSLLEFLVSSVTVIVTLERAVGLAYLFNLLSIGDGVTRKSRREETIVDARLGNLTASLPSD